MPSRPGIGKLLRLLPTDTMDAREVARRQEEAYYMPVFRQRERWIIEGLFDAVNMNPTPVHAVQGHMQAIEAFDGGPDLAKIQAPTLP